MPKKQLVPQPAKPSARGRKRSKCDGRLPKRDSCTGSEGMASHIPEQVGDGSYFTPADAYMHASSPLATPQFFFYASGMWGKPRQAETESALYDAAIKALMRRAHSVHEMKKALARRCEDEKLIKNVVERLKAQNLLNDERYAKQFTRLRTESRKQGQFRIARDLRARGIPDKHIAEALKDSAEGHDPADLVRKRIEGKLRLYRGEINEKKIASLYRSLVAAGFPSDVIRKELFRITHKEVPDVDHSDGAD